MKCSKMCKIKVIPVGTESVFYLHMKVFQKLLFKKKSALSEIRDINRTDGSSM